MLTPRLMWFTYNFIVGSQAGMVTEAIVLFSLIIGIFRFDVLKNKFQQLTTVILCNKISSGG